MPRVAISIGDLNGIGIELALKSHIEISKIVEPIYCIDIEMLYQASRLLDIDIPDGFETISPSKEQFTITPSQINATSGRYSYKSFIKAIELARSGEVDAIVTLPIHKKAWEMADIHYKGHTDALRDIFGADAIMMLGCDEMYVALFTEHIPLRDVADSIRVDDLSRFLIDFHHSIFHRLDSSEKIAILGLNPHAGDGGVLGSEEQIIREAILDTHEILGGDIFTDPLVPDVAFTPRVRANYRYYVAMYHDQGLAPLKALYFDEGINVSLNLPILRTSVDHGTAFDIAYSDIELSNLSYINAVKYIYETTLRK